MKISNIIAFSCLILTVSISTIIALNILEEKSREDIGKSLVTVLETVDHGLDVWIDFRKADIQELVRLEEVIFFAEQLIDIKREKNELINNPIQLEIRAFFTRIIDRHGDRGMFIVAPDYTNLSSMRDANIGVKNLILDENPQLLESIFKGNFIITSLMYSDVPLDSTENYLKQTTMFVGCPIRNDESKIIAALLIRLDPKNVFMSMTKSGRIGQSGETYAFDSKGRFVTPSRFEDQLYDVGLISREEKELLQVRILDPGGDLTKGFIPTKSYKDLPLTFMARQVLAVGKGQNTDGYRDYRGIRVLGSWLWRDEIGIGLTTEIDEEEGMSSFYYTRNTILSLLAIIIITTFLIAFYLARVRKKEQSIREKLVQSDKMVSLGLLSAGIAHELNNPVNFIKGGITGIQGGIDEILNIVRQYEKLNTSDNHELEEIEKYKAEIDFPELKEHILSTISDIEMGATRSMEILLGLKNFSRVDNQEKSYANIHECIGTAITLLTFNMKFKVKFMKNYDNNIGEILCYPGELNQVFVNILSNAEQAIEDNGVIEITTRKIENDIRISIKDNGSGMSKESINNIFKPFYTTKKMGQGTGLGLSISQGIIKKHGGEIEVMSEEGKGSEFVITLPNS